MSLRSWLDRWGDTLAASLLGLIALYDIGIGLFMLLSPTPGLAHGPGTLWVGLPDDPATQSLLRRLGAFSLHAGVAMGVWAALGRSRPPVLLGLLCTCALTGLGFAWTDRSFFADTPYLAVKNGLGAVFALAFLAHLGARWARRS